MRRVDGGTTCLLGMILAATTAACAASPASQAPASPRTTDAVAVGVSAAPSTPPSSAAPATASVTSTALSVRQVDLVEPTALSVLGSTIWAVAQRDVVRVVPSTGATTILGIGNGDQLAAIEATPGAVWVADFDGQDLLRIDPASAKLVARIDVASPIRPLAVGDAIWVTNHHEGSITRVDARTNKVIDMVSIGDHGEGGPGALVRGYGSVWAADPNMAQVVRLDEKTAAVTARIPVPKDFGACGEPLVTDDAIWMTGCSQSSDMARIDPATNEIVARVELGGYGIQPVLVDGAIWVAVLGSEPPGVLVRVDPATNTVTRRIPVDGLTSLGGTVIVDGTLWVANGTDRLIGIPVSELAEP